jgi:hypothetical protein
LLQRSTIDNSDLGSTVAPLQSNAPKAAASMNVYRVRPYRPTARDYGGCGIGGDCGICDGHYAVPAAIVTDLPAQRRIEMMIAHVGVSPASTGRF